MLKLAPLPDRAVLAVDGDDRIAFLQGLVSNDVALAVPGHAVWAALLTPQGKYLADFFVFADGDRLLLDCERAQAATLATRLSRHRLRAKVAVTETALHVVAAWDGEPAVPAGAIAAPDPRLPAAGWRILSEAPLPPAEADDADYDRHRLLLGLPDGTRDCELDRTVLLEAGFDELGGISWTKGCYMGQELTARTRYRGLLKRRLVPVASDAALPPPGTLLQDEAGREAGTMRSSRERLGLAVLRLEHLHGTLAHAGGTLQARVPDWMRLPDPAA